MRVGYVRVCTAKQNEKRQFEQLKGQVKKVFCDRAFWKK